MTVSQGHGEDEIHRLRVSTKHSTIDGISLQPTFGVLQPPGLSRDSRSLESPTPPQPSRSLLYTQTGVFEARPETAPATLIRQRAMSGDESISSSTSIDDSRKSGPDTKILFLRHTGVSKLSNARMSYQLRRDPSSSYVGGRQTV